MEKADLKEQIMETLQRLNIKSFDFEEIRKIIAGSQNNANGTESSIDMSPKDEELLCEAVRELIIERKIAPVPHGKPIFFVTKQQ